MRIPFKPPANETANSQKASDAVAIQLINELEMNTLSDQVLSDLTENSDPSDSVEQVSFDLSKKNCHTESLNPQSKGFSNLPTQDLSHPPLPPYTSEVPYSAMPVKTG